MAQPEEHGGSSESAIVLDSDLKELERLEAFIDAFCERENLPEKTRYHLHVAIEELVVNAIRHGACDPPQGAIRLAMRMEAGEVRLTLCDTGRPFDPLSVPAPDLTASVVERPVGGLGVHLVRCLIPDIRYERREARNWLYLAKPVVADDDDSAL
ncbi:MAG TPA: ATP-binding protein [Bryobacteraceae bacterium]|nr:ATP-binding protein [Bryobacteraceae bacterium]HOQ47294.1 ATP-binding protein [Bryobacteraceae bacterium]HPQ16599.1 ATP-binding protein [Bryobacteraceae bacterium]HPU73754.1 ATP-binding protein [Bryobacteraceae bacterium]